MCSGPQGAGQLQGPHPPTHAPLGRAQHGASGGEAQALHAGLEGVLRDGANAKSLARAGRVATPSTEGYPAQTLEAAQGDLSGTQGAGGLGGCGQTGGGQLPQVVAQQRRGHQESADHCVL